MTDTQARTIETRERDFTNTRRYSYNNACLSRGWGIWDAAVQRYVGPKFRTRREAEPAAEAAEAARQPFEKVEWYVIPPRREPEHRPVAALWMRPAMTAPYPRFQSEAEALDFVSKQQVPENWTIVREVFRF